MRLNNKIFYMKRGYWGETVFELCLLLCLRLFVFLYLDGTIYILIHNLHGKHTQYNTAADANIIQIILMENKINFVHSLF